MKKLLITFVFLLMAKSLFSQLSPGDLSEPHAHLEGLSNCTKCHEIGKQVLAAKCLDCHTLLNERIKKRLGLHANPHYKDCVTCHSEHQGKEFDLIWWKEGLNNFDHSEAGYRLEGKHGELDCRQCHTASSMVNPQKYRSRKKNLNKTYLGLDQECLTCHYDEHRGQFEKECLSCHHMASWKPATLFNHSQTRFPLTGKHISVACQLCHKKIVDKGNTRDLDYLKFSDIGFSSCSNCHKDPHDGRLGRSCVKCHNSESWKGVANLTFDHSNTRFPLLGQHKKLDCNQCHNANRSLKNIKFHHCSNCHSDYHQGQFLHRSFKGACEECHTEKSFRPANFTIAQHFDTQYPLEGAHLAVPCNLCHKKTFNGTLRFRFTSTMCLGCHSDPHQGQTNQYVTIKKSEDNQDRCKFCHSVESWQTITYDHSKTNFMLEGKHLLVTCGACHKGKNSQASEEVQFKISKNDCQDCHQDIHMGQFAVIDSAQSGAYNGTKCNRCHMVDNWSPGKFDHNRDARFKLEGAHKKLTCSQCHNKVEIKGKITIHYKPLETSCSSCHKKRSMTPEGIKL